MSTNKEASAVEAPDIPAELAVRADGADPNQGPDLRTIQHGSAGRGYVPSKTAPKKGSEKPEPMPRGETVKHGPAPGDIVVW